MPKSAKLSVVGEAGALKVKDALTVAPGARNADEDFAVTRATAAQPGRLPHEMMVSFHVVGLVPAEEICVSPLGRSTENAPSLAPLVARFVTASVTVVVAPVYAGAPTTPPTEVTTVTGCRICDWVAEAGSCVSAAPRTVADAATAKVRQRARRVSGKNMSDPRGRRTARSGPGGPVPQPHRRVILLAATVGPRWDPVKRFHSSVRSECSTAATLITFCPVPVTLRS